MSVKKKIEIVGIIAIGVIIVICIVFAVLLQDSGESDEEPVSSQVIEEKLVAYETDLRDSLDSMTDNETVASYLMNWAKNRGISCSTDKAGNVTFALSPSIGCGSETPTVIVCSFDADNMEYCVSSMAVALCAAKNAENHGRISIIFTPSENGDYSSIRNLDSENFSDDSHVIYLSSSSSAKISVTTGGYRYYNISRELEYEEPAYDTAYRITIENCPSDFLSADIDDSPNPIKALGDILANFKSNSFLFELSSFSGGTNSGLTPSDASMTIVINSSDESKFISRMDSSISKFMNKYADSYPDITYTYEKTDLPEQVLSVEDTNDIVSLMYTAFDGVYCRDDSGSVIALTNMGTISLGAENLSIGISALGCDEDVLDELSESYETICGLCDLDYTLEDRCSVFSSQDNSEELFDDFYQSCTASGSNAKIKQEDAVEYSPCGILGDMNESMEIIYCGVTDQSKYTFAEALIAFLDSGGSEENT